MIPVLMVCFFLCEFTFGSAPAGSSAGNTFTSTCSKLIKKNPATFDLLNIAQFPKDVVAKSLHDALYTQFLHDGADEAKQIANNNEITTENEFIGITPSQFGGVMCKMINIVLEKRGIVTEENAQVLAKHSVQDVADAAPYYDTSTALGIWQSFVRGYQHFYSRLGLTLDDVAQDMTDAYAEAL